VADRSQRRAGGGQSDEGDTRRGWFHGIPFKHPYGSEAKDDFIYNKDSAYGIYLATIAEKLKICILAVSHTNRKKDVDVQEKAHGAGSGINVARVNLYLDVDREGGDPDERILADAGSNIKVGKSIVFKIVEQPPFELDGVTHKEIAIAVFDRETETTAQDMLTGGESPTIQSQARDIATWLIEYLTDKGEVRKDVVVGAAKQFNKDWTQANIEKTFNRRLKKLSHSRTTGGGKNKVTTWSLGKKEQAHMPFLGETQTQQEMTA